MVIIFKFNNLNLEINIDIKLVPVATQKKKFNVDSN